MNLHFSPVEQHLLLAGWRMARERIRQQAPTLRTLFEAARAARDAQPMFPVQSIEHLTEDQVAALSKFFEQMSTATGTRDAYATAVVMVLDDILKELRRYWAHVPCAPKTFTTQINGVQIPKVFRVAGNSARHYLDWRRPIHTFRRSGTEYANVRTIARVLGRPAPEFNLFPTMANNWSWPILHAVGGGTFDGLIAKVRDYLDELIRTVGMEHEPLVVEEIAKETSRTSTVLHLA